MLVATQKALAKKLDVSVNTIQSWRTREWFPQPNAGPYDVQKVRHAAVMAGMRMPALSEAELEETTEPNKLKLAAQAVGMQKRIADLELVQVRKDRIILDMQERQKHLVPVKLVRDVLMENATDMRSLLVSLRQKCQNEIADQIERVIGRLEQRVTERLKAAEPIAESSQA